MKPTDAGKLQGFRGVVCLLIAVGSLVSCSKMNKKFDHGKLECGGEFPSHLPYLVIKTPDGHKLETSTITAIKSSNQAILPLPQNGACLSNPAQDILIRAKHQGISYAGTVKAEDLTDHRHEVALTDITKETIDVECSNQHGPKISTRYNFENLISYRVKPKWRNYIQPNFEIEQATASFTQSGDGVFLSQSPSDGEHTVKITIQNRLLDRSTISLCKIILDNQAPENYTLTMTLGEKGITSHERQGQPFFNIPPNITDLFAQDILKIEAGDAKKFQYCHRPYAFSNESQEAGCQEPQELNLKTLPINRISGFSTINIRGQDEAGNWGPWQTPGIFLVNHVEGQDRGLDRILTCGDQFPKDKAYFHASNESGQLLHTSQLAVILKHQTDGNIAVGEYCIEVPRDSQPLLVKDSLSDRPIAAIVESPQQGAVIVLQEVADEAARIQCPDELRMNDQFDLRNLISYPQDSAFLPWLRAKAEFTEAPQFTHTFNLDSPSSWPRIQSLLNERTYNVQVTLENLVFGNQEQQVCSLKFDQTPPLAFLAIEEHPSFRYLGQTIHKVPASKPARFDRSPQSSDLATIEYCIQKLHESPMAREEWAKARLKTDCRDREILLAQPNDALRTDVNEGFWLIRLRAIDRAGNSSEWQKNPSLILIQQEHRASQIKSLSLAAMEREALGIPDLGQQLMDSLKVFDIYRNLPTNYERTESSNIVLSNLITSTINPAMIGYLEIDEPNFDLSSDGRLIVAKHLDEPITLWDAQSGEFLQELPQSSDRIQAIALSDDGQTIITAEDTHLVYRQIESGDVTSIKAHQKNIKDLILSHSGKEVISAGDDGTVRVWDIATRQQVLRLETFTSHLDISQTDDLIFTQGKDVIHVWDTNTGDEINTIDIPNIRDFVMGSNNTEVLFATSSNALALWDTDGQSQRYSMNDHDRVTAMTVTPSEEFMISGGRDDAIRIWNYKDGTLKKKVWIPENGTRAYVRNIESFPDNQKFIASLANGMGIWDLGGQNLKGLSSPGESELPVTDNHTDTVYSIVFLPGNRLASGSRDATIKIWDAETFNVLATLTDHNQTVDALEVTQNGAWLISASHDGDIHVRDSKTLELVKVLDPAESPIQTMVISEDDRLLLAGYRGGFGVWDLASGKKIQSIPIDPDHVAIESIKWFPDGDRVATVDGSQSVSIWSLKSGKRIHEMEGHRNDVMAVAVTADGQNVISAAKGGEIRVWDTKSGRWERSIVGHDDHIYRMVLSPDGQKLATGSRDGTMRIWNLKNGYQIQSFDPGENTILALDFSDDSQSLAFGTGNNSVGILDLSPESLATKICQRLAPYLAQNSLFSSNHQALCPEP